MLRISFTPPDELDISGTAPALKAVLAQLNALANGDETEVFIPVDKNANPAPYDESLNALVGHVTTGPTKVSVIDNCLEVVGSQASFAEFASFFSFDEYTSEGAHNHHEYFDGNTYIHPKSVPLVISIRSAK